MKQFIVLILVRDSVTRFSTLFLYTKKTSPGPHMNRQKRFFKTFSFHVDIGEKTTVCVVNYYADTLSVWSTTTRTLCQRSQGLCGHCVSIVNDYADMCQHSQRLRGHCFKVVNDYADTQEIILLWKK